jgi:hypothetical protein
MLVKQLRHAGLRPEVPTTYTPGIEVPVDGRYVAVDDQERSLGRMLTLRQGKRFPTCLPGETGYVLVELLSSPH